MPRPNTGPKIVWLERRQLFYIMWYERGRQKLRGTGTTDPAKAKKILAAFIKDPGSLRDVKVAFGCGADTVPGKPEVVYFVGGNIGGIKIGVAVNAEERLKMLQTGSPVKLELLAQRPGDRKVESAYHRRFADYRLHGEWFAHVPAIQKEIELINAGKVA